MTGLARMAVLCAAVSVTTGAYAQRVYPLIEQDGHGRTCSQANRNCLTRGGSQHYCEDVKRTCLATGVWGSKKYVVRNLEPR